MKNLDENKPIRDLFENYKAQAPDFDSLFKGEVLGDTHLRQIYQSKLYELKAGAPAFETLFSERIVATPKKRMMPLWITVGAAAACLGLLLLVPSRISKAPDVLTKVEKTKPVEIQKIESKTANQNIHSDVLTQNKITPVVEALSTPIKPLNKIIHDSVENKESHRVSENRLPNVVYPVVLPKPLYERSIQEAYADANFKITKRKHDKITLGTIFNGTNRLLSLLNTKSNDRYALKAAASDYTSGYSSLEGVPSSFLRSSSVSRNDWVNPDNISTDVLQTYKAAYSLPLSLGFSVSLPVNNYLEIITGLNYTYMSGKISGKTSSMSFDLKQELHYLGIPLKLSVNYLNHGSFVAYIALGGSLEKGLSGVQNSHVEKTDDTQSDWHHAQKIYGLQSSLTGQMGLSYNINKTFCLYLEPGISYFIPTDQPVSNRTDEPYNFNVGLGLRYRIH